MAGYRPKIKDRIKEQLVREAGGKCANPGCPTLRVEFHHIKEWSVYRSHDKDHLIAICPTCHDAVHNGCLSIDDATLYRWKKIERSIVVGKSSLYVEPGPRPRLLLGRSAYDTEGEFTVFELHENSKLKFKIVDGEISMISLAMSDCNKNQIIKIVDNNISFKNGDSILYRQIPGHVRLTVPVGPEFLPKAIVDYIRDKEPTMLENGRLILLDIEVIEPGRVRMQGIWIKYDDSFHDAVTIVSKDGIHMLPRGGARMILESSVLEPTPVLGASMVLWPLNNLALMFGTVSDTKPEAVYLVDQAKRLEAVGDREAAIQKLHDAAVFEPTLAYIYRKLAELYVGIGDHNAALDAANKFRYFSPNQAEGFNALGLVYNEKREFDTALTNFEKAIGYDKNNCFVLENMAGTLFALRRIDEAVVKLQAALAIQPGRASLYNTLGLCRAATGDLDGAMTYLQKAVELDKKCGRHMNNLAYIFERKGEKEEAIRLYMLALTIEPSLTTAGGNLSRLQAQE